MVAWRRVRIYPGPQSRTCADVRAAREMLRLSSMQVTSKRLVGEVVELRGARSRDADLFSARTRARCPGRQHSHHIGDICEGTCCTACGGPIDTNEECRC